MTSTSQKRPSTDGCAASGSAKQARTDVADGVPNVLPLFAYYSHRKGERDDMQDQYVIVDDLPLPSSARRTDQLVRVSFYAVYDGHNGARASEYAAQHLHTQLANRLLTGPDLKTVEQAIKRCFIESYKATDDAFLSDASKAKPVWKDGTTATTLLLINNSLFIANLGDSRAILCRYKKEEQKEVALTLTKDHSPQLFEERMRIQKAGGIVKDGRILGILEVSRSIGDGQYKNHGVTCVPDIKKCTLTSDDRYILIACDGLWKTFSNQDVLTYVNEQLNEARKRSDLVPTEHKTVTQLQWESVCSNLAGEAVRRGSGDNVTVVLIVVADHHQPFD